MLLFEGKFTQYNWKSNDFYSDFLLTRPYFSYLTIFMCQMFSFFANN